MISDEEIIERAMKNALSKQKKPGKWTHTILRYADLILPAGYLEFKIPSEEVIELYFANESTSASAVQVGFRKEFDEQGQFSVIILEINTEYRNRWLPINFNLAWSDAGGVPTMDCRSMLPEGYIFDGGDEGLIFLGVDTDIHIRWRRRFDLET